MASIPASARFQVRRSRGGWAIIDTATAATCWTFTGKAVAFAEATRRNARARRQTTPGAAG